MDQSAITVRYAKAFFSLAKEKNALEPIKSDMNLVLSVCKNSIDFMLLLKSPVVKTSRKTELIKLIFEKKTDNLTLNFLMLIIKNKREIHIPGICRNFLSLARKDQNIKSAVLTTATEISQNTINKVKELLAKELNAQIELQTQISEVILGGMILRIDDKQYDASVATQLQRVKQSLLDSELK